MMKKLLLAGLLAVSASVVMQAGPCGASTDLLALNGLGLNNTCDFGGLLFSNFWVSGYNDFGFSSFSDYTVGTLNPSNWINQTSIPNLANYTVNFSGSLLSGITVTMSPKVGTSGWKVTTPFGNSATNEFTFEIKYTVATDPTNRNSPQSFSIVNATLDSAYTSNENFVPDITQATLRKSTQVGQNPIVATSVNNGTLTQVRTNSLTPNPGSSINVTDNILINLDYFNQPPSIPSITGSTTLQVNSFSNGFILSPEPMTLGLMGAGLLGLGLLRRRTAKK